MSNDAEPAFTPWSAALGDRRLRRWTVALPATLLVGARRRPGVVHDISPNGARLALSQGPAPAPGSRVGLELEGYGVIESEIRHASAGVAGLSFRHRGDSALRLARFLLANRPARREPRRREGVDATLHVAGAARPCVVQDLSPGGAGIIVDDTGDLALSGEVELALPGRGRRAATVRRIDGWVVGLRLRDEADPSRLGERARRRIRRLANRLLHKRSPAA